MTTSVTPLRKNVDIWLIFIKNDFFVFHDFFQRLRRFLLALLIGSIFDILEDFFIRSYFFLIGENEKKYENIWPVLYPK